ncbi:MAG: thiamine biosynthesis protein ThiS [Chloroflexi bacterium]|nr:thiamine biosynthesis protein ThiS [Chloroflexota bacterium]
MKVRIRYPKPQTYEFTGRHTVQWVLEELKINPETVIVIKGSSLLTHDVTLHDDDDIEIRYAISGG